MESLGEVEEGLEEGEGDGDAGDGEDVGTVGRREG